MNTAALDAHITGNYGEDYYIPDQGDWEAVADELCDLCGFRMGDHDDGNCPDLMALALGSYDPGQDLL